MQSPLRTLLLLAAVSSVAAIFYSDWADDKCPSVRPPNSAGCSWSATCGSTCVYKHRHVCREINPNGDHYCGDECSETCTALQGGGVAVDVCARDTKGYPGGCVNGNCVAEGSPASAHCYCYPGFTGVHCATGSGTPPPPTTFCVTNEHTAAPLTQNCNNGVCKEGASSFTCACNTGWSGLYCLTDASGAQPAANTWQRNVLDRHNALRANIYGATHGVQPSAASLYQLVWDYNLEQHAQKYADSGKLFDCSALAHSTSPTRTNKAPFTAVGENLFAANVWGEFDPVSAVNSWFDEYVDYTLSTNTCGTGKVCGHYTQVVWANTRAIGCAVKKIMCGANKDVPWYQVICQYGEAGNYKGVSPYVAASDLQTTVTKTYPTPL